jgi:hypothetical protein
MNTKIKALVSNSDLPELIFPAHVSKEIIISDVVKKGNKGDNVKRVQEWLSLRGFGTAIDRDFGPATEHCVKNFQEANHLRVTGIVDQATYDSLISPLKQALKIIPVTPDDKLPNLVLKYAQQHLAQHPLEIGGQNRGPWVRIYLDGNEGTPWAWCAGFVTFILKQACLTLNRPMPIVGSFRCNELAQQAKDKNLFVRSNDITNGTVSWQTLNPCSIFLVRKDSHWSHTGFACQPNGDSFATIEGNTNDDGNAEGYEACIRTRSLSQKDFIRIPQ